jgi:hypothetical protein
MSDKTKTHIYSSDLDPSTLDGTLRESAEKGGNFDTKSERPK